MKLQNVKKKSKYVKMKSFQGISGSFQGISNSFWSVRESENLEIIKKKHFLKTLKENSYGSNLKKAIYYPVQDTAVIPFYDNAYAKLSTGGLATKYDIDAPTMLIIKAHHDNIPVVIDKAHSDRAISQESTTLKREELSKSKKDIMRVFQKICTAPNFEEADAEALGIRVHKTPPDYDNASPIVSDITTLPDQIIFDWVKGPMDGVIIESSYDGAVWKQIGIDLKSPFEDTRKNQVADKPETRYYRFRYLKNDSPVGKYCDVIKVNCDIV
jgi:hypothetical protein